MFFFYNDFGDKMKVYLDLILILNFFLDFFLLLTPGIILKRNINIKLITTSAFIGSLTILILFFDMTSLSLFIIKLILSIIMIIVAYPKKNLKYFFYNLLLFYIASLFLGGTLYMLNINLSYKNNGVIFYHHGLGINFLMLIFLAPLILIFYIKEQKIIKNKYNNYYKVSININERQIKGTGYIDSGNNLTYKRRPVILIDKRKVIFLKEEYRIIPYKVVNKTLFLKIYKCDYVKINNKIIKNIYLGISDDSFNIDGVDILLNNKLMEDIWLEK